MYGWNKSNEIEFKKELTEIVSCRLNLGLFMKWLEKMIMNCTVLDWFMKYVLHEDTDFCRPETKVELKLGIVLTTVCKMIKEMRVEG